MAKTVEDAIQSMIANFAKNTGKPLEAWIAIARKSGKAKHGEIVKFLKDKHGACPMCGGTDRFRFDDKHGNGEYYCNGCGAGDGFTLLEKCLGWAFAEAARRVGEAVGLPGPPVGRRRELGPRSRLRALLQRIWDEAKPVESGDEVAKYLVATPETTQAS